MLTVPALTLGLSQNSWTPARLPWPATESASTTAARWVIPPRFDQLVKVGALVLFPVQAR